MRDEMDLEWFFGDGQTEFFRSTQGAMWERHGSLRWDSRGLEIPRPDDGNYMYVRKTAGTAPSYEPTLQVLHRFGKVSRRLRQVDAAGVTVLGTYYGDSGARWGREAVGRLFCLFPLTPTGRAFLRSDARKVRLEIRPDEAIGAEVHLQAVQPNDIRRRRLAKMREEAEGMLMAAWGAWKATAPPRKDDARIERFFRGEAA